jgi:hypothetical protein
LAWRAALAAPSTMAEAAETAARGSGSSRKNGSSGGGSSSKLVRGSRSPSSAASSTALAAAKVDDVELLSDGEAEPQERTPGQMLESLRSLDYKVRMRYSKTMHTQLVTDDELKSMVAEIEAAVSDKEGVAAKDSQAAAELLTTGERLLAVMAANEYLGPKGKEGKLKEVLAHSERAGWANIKSEPWRALVVARAAKCDYQKAVAALTQTDDLNKAIEIAPATSSGRTVPAPAAPPPRPKGGK